MILTGWKTNTAGLSLIVMGFAQMANGAAHDLDWDMISQGFQNLGYGLAALGIGHKIEKTKRIL